MWTKIKAGLWLMAEVAMRVLIIIPTVFVALVWIGDFDLTFKAVVGLSVLMQYLAQIIDSGRKRRP